MEHGSWQEQLAKARAILVSRVGEANAPVRGSEAEIADEGTLSRSCGQTSFPRDCGPAYQTSVGTSVPIPEYLVPDSPREIPARSQQGYQALGLANRRKPAASFPLPKSQQRASEKGLRSAIDQMMRPHINAFFDPPGLEADDIRLAAQWFMSAEGRDRIPMERYGRHEDPFEFSQLLSARAAELSAKRFYEEAGSKVEDVSVLQLRSPGDERWKNYDLDVDGLPVDVKNSRRLETRQSAPRARLRYTEHCLSRFKQSENGREVRIAGVLSPRACPSVLRDLREECHWDVRFLYLGELTETTYQRLVSTFESPALQGLASSRPTRQAEHFLPAWMFDYPVRLYAKRDEARSVCAEQLKRVSGREALGPNPLPVLIATGLDDPSPLMRVPLAEWETALYQELITLAAYSSLPVLFLTLLRHFLRGVRGTGSAPGNFHPSRYRRFLFRSDRDQLVPVGLYDPLQTIRSLIGVLESLWARRAMLADYRVFQLSGAGILRGKTSVGTDSWDTLVAYCGQCGNDRLVLGDCELCVPHRRLLCSECYCCSAGCGTEQYLRSHFR